MEDIEDLLKEQSQIPFMQPVAHGEYLGKEWWIIESPSAPFCNGYIRVAAPDAWEDDSCDVQDKFNSDYDLPLETTYARGGIIGFDVLHLNCMWIKNGTIYPVPFVPLYIVSDVSWFTQFWDVNALLEALLESIEVILGNDPWENHPCYDMVQAVGRKIVEDKKQR